MHNLFSLLPEILDDEVFEEIVSGTHVRIERILSKGHTSPEAGWYDQAENEWVLVLQGEGIILFADGHEVLLKKGDHITIPAHTLHKVSWTDPNQVTVWLAVFYR